MNVFYELGAAKVQADLDSLFGFSQPLETDIATVVQQSDMRSGSALARCGTGSGSRFRRYSWGRQRWQPQRPVKW